MSGPRVASASAAFIDLYRLFLMLTAAAANFLAADFFVCRPERMSPQIASWPPGE
jgi:hypothetical protein